MKNPVLISILIIFLNSHNIWGGIHFISISDFDLLIEKAQQENKYIFIDFYAEWCGPCKLLEHVFLENEVGEYFNDNFINTRIDVETLQGKETSNKVGVVFLPTMMILDPVGNIVMKTENILTGAELISAAKESISNHNGFSSLSLNSTPFPRHAESPEKYDVDPNDQERVIYIHDDRTSSGRPHIMYHEAYLHLQLMDGKYERVVNKYLSTQEDWSTQKNIKFIFDFLNSVRSKRFEYFIINKARFEEVIGEEKVNKTLQILVEQRLEQGYPRPTFNEALQLFSYLNSKTAEENAYKYYLNRLLIEKRHLEYCHLARTYLNEVNPYDEIVIVNYIDLGLKQSDYQNDLDQYIELMDTAIVLNDANFKYYYLQAELYYLKRDANSALSYISKALALNNNEAYNQEMITLKKKILAL